MQIAAERVGARIELPPATITAEGLKHAAGNLFVAASFFVAALPATNRHETGPASIIWMVGAAIMGIFSLVRIPPRSVLINLDTLAASAGMLVIPCLMRPSGPSAGLMLGAAVVIELWGVALSQVARIYMGRRFGILPANRGIISHGPFAIVRHPIYLGWLILSAGYALSYPSARNILLVIASLPFMVWRIELEEMLLEEDPDYRTYQDRVRFRIWPGVI